MNCAVRSLLVVGLLLLINLVGATTAMASWRCEGDLLTVERISGAVDPRGLVQELPNQLDGTLPGDGILLRWEVERSLRHRLCQTRHRRDQSLSIHRRSSA